MLKDEKAELEQYCQSHMGRLLQQAYREFNARALHKLRQRGHHQLGAAHLNLLPYIDTAGTRVNALAQRAGMTKQAASQLVSELEQYGYVLRQPDPSDGRAALVTFTGRGEVFLKDSNALKHEIEREDQEKLGAERWQVLHDTLICLLAADSPD